MSSSVRLQSKIPGSIGNNLVTLKPKSQITCLKLTSPCKDTFEELSFYAIGSVSDRTLISGFLGTKLIRVYSAGARHQRVDERLEKETGVVLQRLERALERIRDLEMEKLMSRARGELSCEEKQVLENLSEDLVSKFLEKPMEYLQRKDVKLEDKLRDLNALVGMLEQSCLERTKSSNRRL